MKKDEERDVNRKVGPSSAPCWAKSSLLVLAGPTSHRSDAVRVPGPENIVALCARMCAATSVGALRDAMLECLLPYRFLGFTFAAIRKVKSVYLHSEIIATWPRGLQTTFQQHALFNADPVIARSRTAPDAFAWIRALLTNQMDLS